MRSTARRSLYVTSEPPRSPVLLEYGDSFPQFLRNIGQGAAADYLADVAELEAARTRAYHAADATPLHAMPSRPCSRTICRTCGSSCIPRSRC